MPSLCHKIFLHEALQHILAPLHIYDRSHHSADSNMVELQHPHIRLDASGHHRAVISVLMSWSVDLQEHLDLLCLGTYSGAKCTASYKGLDLTEPGVPPVNLKRVVKLSESSR